MPGLIGRKLGMTSIYDANGNPTALHADRYEFWLHRQIRKRVKSGELYLDNSLQHRQFSSELVSIDEKAEVLAQMDIPFLCQSIEEQLIRLKAELHAQWVSFNRELKQGKLSHLEYNKGTQTLTWRKPKVDKQSNHEKSLLRAVAFLRHSRRIPTCQP